MEYRVVILKKAQKNIDKLSLKAKMTFKRLLTDLRYNGPVQAKYKNYSKIGNVTYHCHLDYHWVVCWRCEDGDLYLEVYYVGSRENAPY